MGWGVFGKIKKGLKGIGSKIKDFFVPKAKEVIDKAKEFAPKIQKGFETAKPFLDQIDWSSSDGMSQAKGFIDKAYEYSDKIPDYLEKASGYVDNISDFGQKITFDNMPSNAPIQYDGRSFTPKFKDSGTNYDSIYPEDY